MARHWALSQASRTGLSTGLLSAARDLCGRLSSSAPRQLKWIQIEYAFVRHINGPACAEFLDRLRSELAATTAVPEAEKSGGEHGQ